MRTILIWLQSGGPAIAPLIIVGIASLVLLVEQTVHIVVRSKINARPFMETVISMVRADRIDEALQVCANHQGALPDLGLVVLRAGSRSEGDLSSIVSSTRLTLIPELTRRLAWLRTLPVVLLLIGATGALVNLHDALLQSTPMPLAVAFAVRPLGVALLASLPSVAGHALLTSEARKLVSQLEEFAARLVGSLVSRPDVRLGHRG